MPVLQKSDEIELVSYFDSDFARYTYDLMSTFSFVFTFEVVQNLGRVSNKRQWLSRQMHAMFMACVQSNNA